MPNGLRNCRHKGHWRQVQVIAHNLSELLGRDQLLHLVPREAITQLRAVELHVQPNRDQHLAMGGVLPHRGGIGIVEAQRKGANLVGFPDAVSVDRRRTGDGVEVEG